MSPTVDDPRAVILAEGLSDRAALTMLAARRGRDLDAEGVDVVAMGGATAIRRHLERFGPHGDGIRVAGLCDAAETGDVRRGLERAGFGTHVGDADLAALGFFVCVDDLEDELIRALGIDGVEAVIEAEGELASLRILQRQPAQQGRTPEQQLHRFMGSKGGRKIRYGALLAAALDLHHVPSPLDAVLEAVLTQV